jgi:hypothetical protein
MGNNNPHMRYVPLLGFHGPYDRYTAEKHRSVSSVGYAKGKKKINNIRYDPSDRDFADNTVVHGISEL